MGGAAVGLRQRLAWTQAFSLAAALARQHRGLADRCRTKSQTLAQKTGLGTATLPNRSRFPLFLAAFEWYTRRFSEEWPFSSPMYSDYSMLIKAGHAILLMSLGRAFFNRLDRLLDSAIQNGKPSFLTQKISIWLNDPAWFTPYIVIPTWCNNTAQALPQSVLLKDQQRQVFEQYVQDVLKRHLKRTFSLVQTFTSPVWLTQQMQQRSLTEFQMGSLQADWLSTRRAQIIYGLIGGLVFRPIFGLSYHSLQSHFLS